MEKINKKERLAHQRHSLAHLLGSAVLELYPKVKLALGPAIDNGFYYDFDFGEVKINSENLLSIQEKMHELLPSWNLFERIELGYEEAKSVFDHNEYKLELIEEIMNGNEVITLYKSGNFSDLCRGDHVPNMTEIDPNSFQLDRIAGAYWRGNENNKMLTRIYGLAFETEKDLKDYLDMREEAIMRDHKKIGKDLQLFMFHETAPGMPYWLPKGLIIYNELVNYWRTEHAKLGYQEISSPLVNKSELWKISGHWDHYKNDMFIADMGEGEVYGIKPMNCPNAMIVFKSMQVSYKDLPIRFSDTDRLHRYERSGTLQGLLRCRSFQQDDSHNFISEDMIESEYENIIEICKNFYEIFNLEYSFRLGTRPLDYLGDVETWDKAEEALRRVLDKSGKDYSVALGDGAFYGPKIDIVMKDALGRDWQMGTMQLDFQLPRRFELEYIDRDGKKKTPIVIHRVIYGSLERFIGVLIEHFSGSFPLWLSPVQVIVVPISKNNLIYSENVFKQIKSSGIRVELDCSNETLGKKIRMARLRKIPNVILIGGKEEGSGVLTIERRNNEKIGLSLPDLIDLLNDEILHKK